MSREYKETCRDAIVSRQPGLLPWSAEGIDVPIEVWDTRWTFDVGLVATGGSLVVAECRPSAAGVSADLLVGFAYKVERMRRMLGSHVAGVFMVNNLQGVSAVDVQAFSGIQFAILPEGGQLTDFQPTFLGYSSEREIKFRNLLMRLPPGAVPIADASRPREEHPEGA
jgi:hypothetical protein